MVGDDNSRMEKKLAEYRTIGAADDHRRSAPSSARSTARWARTAPGCSSRTPTCPPCGMLTDNVDPSGDRALAVQNNYQLGVHAIGDRGNREMLNIFEDAFRSDHGPPTSAGASSLAQHFSAADIPRFGKLGVIASMEGVHCTSDAIFGACRAGLCLAQEGAYVWRSLLDSGCSSQMAPIRRWRT